MVAVGTRPPPTPDHAVSGEFFFLEPEVPAPPPPPPVPAAPEPVVDPPKRRRPAQVPKEEATRLAQPAAVAPAADDRPRVEPADSPREQPRPLAVRTGLLPSGSFVLSLDAGVVQEDLLPTGLHAPERPKDLVGALAKETLGRGRVDRGLVHPYYSQLGKALVKNWDAERVAKSGLKGLAEQTAENFKLMNEIWADRASAFGKTGSPIDADALGSNRRAPVNNNIGGVSGVDLEARKEMQRQLREQFKATRRATIRVLQDRDGKLLKVELVEPSNDQNVDKEAMKDVRAAAQKLPPPPEEALEGKGQLSSLWSFELIVSITPPVPTFTFEFDEALGFIDARLPLDRRIYKKVRLVSVE